MIRLLGEASRRPCVLMGRTMKGYALFADALALPAAEAAGWIGKACAFTRTLPTKAPKVAKVAKVAKAKKTREVPRTRARG